MRLIRSKFEAWLKTKKPEEIVGHNRDCHSCPIALWYVEATRGCEIVIFEDRNCGGYTIDRGYSKRPVPAWASSFIFAVDGEEDGKITATRALAVLGEIA